MIVLAPSYLHKSIYQFYRKDNPLFDVKVIDKNELTLGAFPNLKNSAILYLMSNYHYSYDIAEAYLRYLPYVNNECTSRLKSLLKLKNELIEAGYLFNNLVLNKLYKNKQIEVIGYYEDDVELQILASTLDLTLSFKSFDFKKQSIEAYQFPRFEDEVNFIYNEVAYLLDHKVDINDIVIVRRNNEYDYYLNRFAPLFGFRVNLDTLSSWYETGVCVEFMRLYEQSQDINTSLEELKNICQEDDLFEEFMKVVHRFKHNDLSYEVQISYLIHNLKKISPASDKYYPAVRVTSNLELNENKYVFVLGFTQGEFPKTSKDSEYLSPQELELLHLCNAKDKTRFDQQNILDFLKLNNHYVLTFSSKSLQEKKLYPSPIFNLLNIKPVSNPFKEYFYSSQAVKYILSDLLDLAKYYDEKGDRYYQLANVSDAPYDTYDNSFSGAFIYNDQSPLLLSTSKLNDYFGCPFKYFLARVLEVDPFEDSEATILGNIIHKLLELGLLDESYDIETHYLEMVDSSNIEEETKILWKLNLKDQVIKMVNFLRKHPQYMKNPRHEFELVLFTKLDELTTVTGRIDKLVILDDKYVVAVDYKTGSSGDFNVDHLKYGKSTQLPTYAYLLNTSEKYNSYKVTGLYINHIINNKNDMSVKEDDLIPAHLKLSGKSVASIDSFSSFDNTIAGGKSQFVKGISLDKNGDIRNGGKSTAAISEEELEKYIETTKEKYIEAAEGIRKNEFRIYPFMDNEPECRYCKYKDICYVRHYQYHKISKDEEEVDE